MGCFWKLNPWRSACMCAWCVPMCAHTQVSGNKQSNTQSWFAWNSQAKWNVLSLYSHTHFTSHSFIHSFPCHTHDHMPVTLMGSRGVCPHAGTHSQAPSLIHPHVHIHMHSHTYPGLRVATSGIPPLVFHSSVTLTMSCQQHSEVLGVVVRHGLLPWPVHSVSFCSDCWNCAEPQPQSVATHSQKKPREEWITTVSVCHLATFCLYCTSQDVSQKTYF